ncbi:DUF3097 family protein [Nitriliruptoraceae bacterium ZYF776]|nr:DUF3097 family protein [Profundirhabdus halotolerans]
MIRVDDVLAPRRPPPPREVEASPGLLVEVLGDGFAGQVVACDLRRVSLRDRRGRTRHFSLQPGGFVVDDRPVTLTPPRAARPAPVTRTTASGSIAAPKQPARVARASRILVEGIHDAALVETVWGDDLRVEGVVVDVLHGIDDLPAVVRAFTPGPQRRLGVLVDHLVPGSKEARVAAEIRDRNVLVTGHPFVDVWAAVRPEVVGIPAWPDVPRGEDWKTGTARRLGYDDPTDLWRHIARSVRSWRDLDRALIGAVERLIDHVTAT